MNEKELVEWISNPKARTDFVKSGKRWLCMRYLWLSKDRCIDVTGKGKTLMDAATDARIKEAAELLIAE